MEKINQQMYPQFIAPDRTGIAVLKQLEDMQETNLAILEALGGVKPKKRSAFQVLKDTVADLSDDGKLNDSIQKV